MADKMHDWEQLYGNNGDSARMRVPTGWIYRVRQYSSETAGFVFVPCEPMDYLKRMFPDGVQKG